ncbi:MAG TPA: chemotaxis protein CheW [Spirochaetota bacterium]|nr:chemotaxis protein CheW [Spirochaetota bacterium]HOM37864.1 chemotaxis protein CheW [Spirochaetota bacterium]HPQ48668.1 chemotaxis protein CheW [Spirochaetota bacterium]
MDGLEELKQEFLSEAYELLHTMEEGLLKLEKDPKDISAINEIFRVAHTLKGGAGALELNRIAEYTHELENLLDKVRDGHLNVDENIVDICLKSLDLLKSMIDAAAKGIEPEEGIEDDLLKSIKAIFSKDIKNTEKPKKDKQIVLDLKDYELELINDYINKGFKVYDIIIEFNPNYEMRSVSGLHIYTMLKEIGQIIYCAPHVDVILEEEFTPAIRVIFATELDKETLYKKVYISDVVSSLNISHYEVDNKSIKEDSKIDDKKVVSEKDFINVVGDKIKDRLLKGFNVYKIEIEIEKDNPMRTVDSILLYNTLEEMGEILNAIPDKETLRMDKFFQTIEVILATNENKERIKEKCLFSGTTKSIKISVFKPKEEGIKTEPTEKEINNEDSQAGSKEVIKKDSKKEESTQKSFLRVESSRVDLLMNLVSELVISKASLIETSNSITSFINTLKSYGLELKRVISNNSSDKETEVEKFLDFITKSSWNVDNFENIINIISRIINDLQEGVMKIRMVPISTIFNRFPRIIRDLSKNLNKKIELEIYGEETELDKSVVEELLDPLVHMVRNSIDHGIELPSERLKKGKNEAGKIKLSASHEGSMIKIEIEDDGAGINLQRVKAKAIEKGLIPENKEMSKEEIINLIFLPGFSTASTVTEVSGRGVGMDVVKQKIENLSGSIFVDTETDKGTRFIIKIPLTLAIIQALIVDVNGYSYSIPINSIVETLTIKDDQIETFEKNKVFRLREEIITLIDLKEIFNIKTKRENIYSDSLLETKEIYVVVVEVANKKAGFLVDSIVAEQDIVIKPLHKKYAMTKGISGATILGDGSISLIIDIYQLIDLYIKKEEYISIR